MEHESKQQPETCEKCGKTEKLKRCSGCHQAWYCSQECQVAAWKGHKADCKRWKQQITQQQDSEPPLTAAAAARSSSARDRPDPAAAAVAAAPSSSSSGSGNAAPRRTPRVINRQLAAAAAAAAAGSSSSSGSEDEYVPLPDDALLPFFKYRTNADPKAGDLKNPPKFSRKELAYLAEVYPGMLVDGDSCTINLDRFIMKKVKTWYVQYLMRRQLPGTRSDQDGVPFFKALMSGEVRIASASMGVANGIPPPDFVLETIELGVAVAVSMMVDHSPAGRRRHPANMPKFLIYEPDTYSNERILV
uniref:MYND-type domain-containing protein n=1 Tax=Tetradesmus obliquus TaxID=3088 RepID=A0A383VQP2_TETOB|eukprot:jgi/Sobl393_1/3836/SZX67835.1